MHFDASTDIDLRSLVSGSPENGRVARLGAIAPAFGTAIAFEYDIVDGKGGSVAQSATVTIVGG